MGPAIRGHLKGKIKIVFEMATLRKMGGKFHVLKTFSVLIAVFINSVLAAQSQKKIDSLKNILLTKIEDTTRIKVHLNIAWRFIRSGSYKEGVDHSVIALGLLDSLKR